MIGSRKLLEQTNGVVTPFAQGGDSLLERLYKVRKVTQTLTKQRKIDLVASHFALYTAPLGGEIKKLPLVVHFHGPWAAESDVEGSTARRSQLKLALNAAYTAEPSA